MTDSTAVGVSVLGPVAVMREGQRVAVRPGKSTELLVRLALEAGELVRTERLIEDLWADDAVTTARNTLQSKVSSLRRAFGDAGLVEGSSAGYTLRVDPSAVDALAIVSIAERAFAARAAGDNLTAVECSSSALAMVRGDLMPGGGDGAWLRPHRARLEELRLSVLECHLGARVDIGAADVVSQLEAAVRDHPWREALWATLMLALYRDGRQADALAAYTRARHGLIDELGLEPGPELRALEERILLQDPSLGRLAVDAHRSTEASVGFVPVITTSLVGRADDLDRLSAAIIANPGLVTIVGPAGVGKTRLSIEAARHAATTTETWFVRLETATDETSMTQAMVETMGLSPGSRRRVIDQLRHRDALVVLDNAEHIIDIVADFVPELLAGAPRLRVLCTSQLPVGVDGEVVHALQPLTAEDAVALFVSRAVEHRRSFSVDERGAEVVGEVCRALDGLPLAIELAAARVKTLAIEDIGRRLEDRFPLLSDPTHRGPARRRALGAAIGWSYDLLFPDDQCGLWAIACFTGGATLDGVERVLVALQAPTGSALDIVGRLVDRSLVVVDEREGSLRYRLLDSIRAFAMQRLDDAGFGAVAREAHATWIADVADACRSGVRGAEQADHLTIARAEWANIDAALSWAERERADVALRIASGFGWAWFVLGDGPAGAARIRGALAAGPASAGQRADALTLIAWLDASVDLDVAEADARLALSSAVDADDEALQWSARLAIAFVVLQKSMPDVVLDLLDAAPQRLAALGRAWDQGAAWVLRAHASLAMGDVVGARAACITAEPLVRAADDAWAGEHVENVLGILAQVEGRLPDAADHLRRASAASARLGFRALEGLHLANLGGVLDQLGEDQDADAALRAAMAIGRSTQDLRLLAIGRARWARLAHRRGLVEDADEAARAALHWFDASGGGDDALVAAAVIAAIDATR